MGGWPGGVKIKIKVHLSPAEAEIRVELGNMLLVIYLLKQFRIFIETQLESLVLYKSIKRMSSENP